MASRIRDKIISLILLFVEEKIFMVGSFGILLSLVMMPDKFSFLTAIGKLGKGTSVRFRWRRLMYS
jgi:hypothetical protein